MELFQTRPMPDEHLLTNAGLYIRSSALAKFYFLEEMYRKILKVPGNILIYGLWWGQDAIVLENLRAILEPYNAVRRIVGFDTFEGYPEHQIGEYDIRSDVITGGGYSVSQNYLNYLNALTQYHEDENIMYNIKKVSYVKGDVTETVPGYFKKHPEAITAMAYFDLALYEPTKACLEWTIKSCVKGSVIVFDELTDENYPGECIALRELVDTRNLRIERSDILPDRTYWVFE